MLTASKEHREVFSEPPLVAIRRYKNLKDILVTSKLYSGALGSDDSRGCSLFCKSRCHACKVVCYRDTFRSHKRDTCTSFRFRCNNYKACYQFIGGSSGTPKADFFHHFVGEGNHGFLEDVGVTIIDGLNGTGRQLESFWQYKLGIFAPQGLNIRQVDI